MARIKGIKNKNPSPPPETTLLDDHERLDFIANLIIDQVFNDQARDYKLLQELTQHYE